MAGFLSILLMLGRVALALFCVIVLSPLPDGPRSSSAAFLTLFSALEGEPSVVIWKSQYSLTLYKGNAPFKTYHAVFGKGYADGDKLRSGDRRTPEGEFYVCSMNNSKRFYKFLGLSYPSLKHAEQGLRRGAITPVEYDAIARALATGTQPTWDTRLGGAIGIHGRMLEDPVAQVTRQNWTDGCIALLNRDIDELFGVIRIGTPVTILP